MFIISKCKTRVGESTDKVSHSIPKWSCETMWLNLSKSEVVRQNDSLCPKVRLLESVNMNQSNKMWREAIISEVSHKCTKLFITERAKYFKYIHLFSIMRREIELFGLILSSRCCYYSIDRKWWMSFRIIPYPCSSILPSMFVDNTIQ